MKNSELKALEIAAQLTAAKLSNDEAATNEYSGSNAVDFFKEIYKGIKEITDAIAD